MDDLDTSGPRTLPPALTVAAGFFAPLLVCVGLLPLRGTVANTSVALLLILLVVSVARLWGRRDAYLAVLSVGLWFDLFWTVPVGSFAITDGDHLETTVMVVVVGAVVIETTTWGRRQQQVAARRAGYLDGVIDGVIDNAGVGSVADHRRLVADRIVALLGLDRCRFVDRAPRDLPVLGTDGIIRIDGVALAADAELPTTAELVLPVRGDGRLVGAYLGTAATTHARPDLERRRVAAAIAERAGSLTVDTTGEPADGAH